MKILIIASVVLLSSCSKFEQLMQEQKLECHPIQATECIGWATEDTLTIISEEDI
jgi:hypothetical protein